MSTVEILTLKEIKEKYPNEWVLIEYEELDSLYNVIKGHVISHSPVKESIYKDLMETKGKNVALEYTGIIEEDMAVMF